MIWISRNRNVFFSIKSKEEKNSFFLGAQKELSSHRPPPRPPPKEKKEKKFGDTGKSYARFPQHGVSIYVKGLGTSAAVQLGWLGLGKWKWHCFWPTDPLLECSLFLLPREVYRVQTACF